MLNKKFFFLILFLIFTGIFTYRNTVNSAQLPSSSSSIETFGLNSFDYFLEQYRDDSQYNRKRLYIIHLDLNKTGIDRSANADVKEKQKAVATLFVGPNGKMLLYDAGRCHFQAKAIRSLVHEINDINGRKRNLLDYLVISHPHKDHNAHSKCNGQTKTAYGYLTDELDISKTYNYNSFPNTKKMIDAGLTFTMGDIDDPVIFFLVAANKEIYQQSRPGSSTSPNDYSLVFLVRWRDFVYYIGGDLHGGGNTARTNTPTVDFESPVADAVYALAKKSVDVIKVNHHGSSTSSNEYFLNKLMPDDRKFRNAIMNVTVGYVNLPSSAPVQRILNHIRSNTNNSDGNTYLWQTHDGGLPNSSSTSNTRRLIANNHIWIRASGNRYSIRTKIAGVTEKKHGYDAITAPNWDWLPEPDNTGTYFPFVGDFNGDGTDDVGVWNQESGRWFVAISLEDEFMSARSWLSDWHTDDITFFVGHLDNDNKSDLMVFKEPDGNWFGATSLGNAFAVAGSHSEGLMLSNWKSTSQDLYRVFVGNFDGDDDDDVVAMKLVNGEWYVALNNGNATFNTNNGTSHNGLWLRNWGHLNNQYIQVVGDFNGDGKDDLAAYKLSNGSVSIALSDGITFNPESQTWLESWREFDADEDQILSGDFNGDGYDDLLVFTQSTRHVYVALNTGNGSFTTSRWAQSWDILDSGQDFEVLVGDFNGDSKDDIIAFDDDHGDWYVGISNNNDHFDIRRGSEETTNDNYKLWLSNWGKNGSE